ncbi:MAG: DUF3857 and transglutaminase domain-containing protein [bacterium]|nr:DUF3857 and transglutaminase domain-containing protein [bacterium]
MKKMPLVLVPALGLVLCLAPFPAPAADTPLPPGDRPPPTAFTRLEDAGDAEAHPGADLVVVFEETVNRVAPSGVTEVDGYRLTKVLTPAGCRDRSVLTWRYDPQSSRVEVREVSVLRDGERLPVDVAAVRDLPAPQSAIYWSDRIMLLQLPRLRPGDGIEVRTLRKGFTYALLGSDDDADDDARFVPPMPGEYFDIVLFAEDAPILEKRYVLSLPAGKRLHAEVHNGALFSSVTYDAERTEHAWWGRDLPALVHETRQPAASDFAPKVVMATVADWESKSRWFFDVNRGQFDATPEIRAKVDAILAAAGLTGAAPERKAEALLHWVAQNIRYSGQTMGPGEGFILHSGAMVFEQRSGVCKDIAGMLVTMLRAAGLDAQAAMTMAGSRIEDVPADQFNHCVTALRLPDGSFRMYDPTWVPYDNSIWSYSETEQHYLVGSPEGSTLDRIAYSPPSDSPLHAVHRATLAADGTLTGEFELTGRGVMDGRLRGLANARRDELAAVFARALAAVSPRVEGVRVTHRRTDDFGGDMRITVAYRIPRYALPVDGGLEFRSPLMQLTLHDGTLFRAGATAWEDERATDVLLYFTQLLDGQETIRLPRGWRAADAEQPDAVDETYAAFSGASRLDGSDLVITQRFESRRRQVPPDGYPGFKKAVDAARAWGDRVFRAEKGGAR